MKTDPFHINDIFTISSDQEFNDKAIQIFHHQTKHREDDYWHLLYNRN